MLAEEGRRGLQTLATYQNFQAKADRVKNDLLVFLIEQKYAGKTVAAYGAAKGNTLLNYAGIKPDLLPFVCDAAAAKQGKFMPGSHIPILAPAALIEQRPDYLVILPWNIAAEVKQQNARLAELGTRFVHGCAKTPSCMTGISADWRHWLCRSASIASVGRKRCSSTRGGSRRKAERACDHGMC